MGHYSAVHGISRIRPCPSLYQAFSTCANSAEEPSESLCSGAGVLRRRLAHFDYVSDIETYDDPDAVVRTVLQLVQSRGRRRDVPGSRSVWATTVAQTDREPGTSRLCPEAQRLSENCAKGGGFIRVITVR